MELKLGFSSLGCPSFSVDQIIEAACAYGYRGVSLRTVRGESMLPSLEEFSPAALVATSDKFKKAGIDVMCVSSGVRFTSPDPKEREKQLDIARQYILIAKGLGSPYVRIFGGPYPADQDRAEVLGWIIEGFRAACDFGAREGVSIFLETHDSFSRGVDAADLVRRVDRNNLFIVWDILHSLRFGESLAETWDAVGDHCRHIHLKDSVNFNPESFDFALLGRGKVPVREAVKLLLDNGYAGYLEFEWEKGWHPDIPGPELAFPHGAGYLECLWQMLVGEGQAGDGA